MMLDLRSSRQVLLGILQRFWLLYIALARANCPVCIGFTRLSLEEKTFLTWQILNLVSHLLEIAVHIFSLSQSLKSRQKPTVTLLVNLGHTLSCRTGGLGPQQVTARRNPTCSLRS